MAIAVVVVDHRRAAIGFGRRRLRRQTSAAVAVAACIAYYFRLLMMSKSKQTIVGQMRNVVAWICDKSEGKIGRSEFRRKCSSNTPWHIASYAHKLRMELYA